MSPPVYRKSYLSGRIVQRQVYVLQILRFPVKAALGYNIPYWKTAHQFLAKIYVQAQGVVSLARNNATVSPFLEVRL